MILGITGHRSDKIGGFLIPNPTYEKVYSAVVEKFNELCPEKIISGMALGVDSIVCWTALELNIPYIAAVPFEGQEGKWPEESRRKYKHLLSLAEKVVIVSPGSYSAEKMQIRNKWIINNSDSLLAIWNGDTKGGTFNAVKYAQEQQKARTEYKIHRINPKCL